MLWEPIPGNCPGCKGYRELLDHNIQEKEDLIKTCEGFRDECRKRRELLDEFAERLKKYDSAVKLIVDVNIELRKIRGILPQPVADTIAMTEEFILDLEDE